jgi:hypothetical protein
VDVGVEQVTWGNLRKPRVVDWLARAIFAGLGVVAVACLAVMVCVKETSPLVHVAQAGLVASVALGCTLWCER